MSTETHFHRVMGYIESGVNDGAAALLLADAAGRSLAEVMAEFIAGNLNSDAVGNPVDIDDLIALTRILGLEPEQAAIQPGEPGQPPIAVLEG